MFNVHVHVSVQFRVYKRKHDLARVRDSFRKEKRNESKSVSLHHALPSKKKDKSKKWKTLCDVRHLVKQPSSKSGPLI